MRNRGIVEPQTLFGLAEVPASDVRKHFQVDLHIGIEGINIVERDEARFFRLVLQGARRVEI
jgi:hypothetical protein